MAENTMLSLFNNRRINIIVSPVFMGLLPEPNAVLLSAPIVDSSAGDTIDAKDKAFITSYFRHIPESALPLYPAVLLGVAISELSPGYFLAAMIPMMAVSFIVPYFTTVRKVPKEAGLSSSISRSRDVLNLLIGLSPILILILLVVTFGVKTSLATGAIVLALFFVYRISFKEVLSILKYSVNINMMTGMVFLLVFKDMMLYTGVIEILSELYASIPIPLFLTYSIVMFVGSLMGLGTAMIAVIFPVAFTTVEGAGIPLLVLLMSFHHAALQLTPTHICLDIATKHFKIDFVDLVIKTLPVTVFYCATSVLYYILCTTVLQQLK